MSERVVLGLETSCDETAAAVVRLDPRAPDGPGEILSNVVWGQGDLHARYGGVVPEIAARAHAERADLVMAEALRAAGLASGALDAVAVTAGPGLIGGVMAGVMAAEGFARGIGRPVLAVNHLEGHALTPRLSHGLAYPYLMLLVSGGHCQILAVEGLGRYARLGGTIDDAPGEAFDKVAKLLGLGFPGGPEVERRAAAGDGARFVFPRPLIESGDGRMSFSGLKTAVVRAVERLVAAQGGLHQRDVEDLSAGFQAAAAEILARKTADAMSAFAARSRTDRDARGRDDGRGDGLDDGRDDGLGDALGGSPDDRADREPAPGSGGVRLAVAGGVAANAALRSALGAVAARAGAELTAPPLALCTDNGAMIAWAGGERLVAGVADAPVVARPRWPLDETSAPLLGAGRKGAKA